MKNSKRETIRSSGINEWKSILDAENAAARAGKNVYAREK